MTTNWITKTIYITSEGNETTEISKSMTKEHSETIYKKQIQRWYNIIVEDYDTIPVPLRKIWEDIDIDDENECLLKLINIVLDITNLYCDKKNKTSFTILKYTENN